MSLIVSHCALHCTELHEVNVTGLCTLHPRPRVRNTHQPDPTTHQSQTDNTTPSTIFQRLCWKKNRGGWWMCWTAKFLIMSKFKCVCLFSRSCLGSCVNKVPAFCSLCKGGFYDVVVPLGGTLTISKCEAYIKAASGSLKLESLHLNIKHWI